MQVFSCENCKFSKNTFLQNSFRGYFWGLTRIFTKESRTKIGATASNKYHIQLQKSIYCRKNSEETTVGVKRRPATLLLERGSSFAKFLRTLVLKNFCERLLLKISISVRNLEAVVQRCSVKKMFLEISQNSQESNCARASF